MPDIFDQLAIEDSGGATATVPEGDIFDQFVQEDESRRGMLGSFNRAAAALPTQNRGDPLAGAAVSEPVPMPENWQVSSSQNMRGPQEQAQAAEVVANRRVQAGDGAGLPEILLQERTARGLPPERGYIDNRGALRKTKVEQVADAVQSGVLNMATGAAGLVAPDAAWEEQRKLNENLQSDPRYQGNFLLDTLPKAAGGTVPFVVSNIAVPGSGFAVGAASGAGQARMEARQFGASSGTEAAATVGGGILGASEGILPWFGGGKAGGVVRRMFKSGLVESAQEVAQQTGTNGLAKWLYDKDREILEGVGDGGAAGFVMGSVFGGLAGRVRDGRTNKAAALAELARMEQAWNTPPQTDPNKVPPVNLGAAPIDINERDLGAYPLDEAPPGVQRPPKPPVPPTPQANLLPDDLTTVPDADLERMVADDRFISDETRAEVLNEWNRRKGDPPAPGLPAELSPKPPTPTDSSVSVPAELPAQPQSPVEQGEQSPTDNQQPKLGAKVRQKPVDIPSPIDLEPAPKPMPPASPVPASAPPAAPGGVLPEQAARPHNLDADAEAELIITRSAQHDPVVARLNTPAAVRAFTKSASEFFAKHGEADVSAPALYGDTVIITKSSKPGRRFQATLLSEDGVPGDDVGGNDYKRLLTNAQRAFGMKLEQATVEPKLGANVRQKPGKGIEYLGSGGGKLMGQAVNAVAKTTANIASFFSGEHARSARRSPEGTQMVADLDDAQSKAQLLEGRWLNEAKQARDLLQKDTAAKEWLMSDSVEPGHANIQLLLEGRIPASAIPNSPAIVAFDKAYRKMLSETMGEAKAKKMQREANGKLIPVEARTGGAFIRQFTPDLMEQMTIGHGALLDQFISKTAADNPGMTIDFVRDYMKQQFGPDSARKVGSLEDVRKIPNMPTHDTVNGKRIEFLETDPWKALTRAGEFQAKRIYFAEKFGQGLLGQPTKIETIRQKHSEQLGSRSAKDIDQMVQLYFGRAYGNMTDPRSSLRAAASVANILPATLHTSAAAIPNLFQPFMTLPYVGAKPWVKGVYDVVTKPKQVEKRLVELGVIKPVVHDWTVEPGRTVEDWMKNLRQATSILTFQEYVAHKNNLVSGAQAMRAVDDMKASKKIDDKFAERLRLEPAEVAAIRSGNMTLEIEAKIVQNIVKQTQFIGESRFRRSKFQNIPIWNQIISHQSYAIGTAKNTWNFTVDALKALKNPTTAAPAFKRLFYHAVGLGVAGALTLAVKNMLYRDQPEEEKTWHGFLAAAFFESALFGSTSNMMRDAFFDKDNGRSASDALVRLSPKVSMVADAPDLIFGTGRDAKFDRGEALGRMLKKHTPVVKHSIKAYERALTEGGKNLDEYNTLRNKVFAWEKAANPKNDDSRSYSPINPDYEAVREALRRGQYDDAKELAKTYKDSLPTKERRKAMENLRNALKSPIGLSEENRSKFLQDLEKKTSKAERAAAWKLDNEWRKTVHQMN